MAPPALFKNFGKASLDLFKDDNWSSIHKLEISNKNAQQALNASIDGAGKSEYVTLFSRTLLREHCFAMKHPCVFAG